MMNLGVMMWPIQPWRERRELWRRAEELGFAHAWTADHIAWRGHTPWFDGFVTLAGAAEVTNRIRLGTLVTSPNFRHPVPTAHMARTIDDMSEGRLIVGIGSGGTARTSDSGALGGELWTPRERADRFAEWVDLFDRLLRGGQTTYTGTYYSAQEVNTTPGCVQHPRIPFAIAGNGPRGMHLAATHADTWITTANPKSPSDFVRTAMAKLDEACESAGRAPTDLRRLLLTGFTDEPWLESLTAFQDLAGHYTDLGITDLVLHWPRPDTPWAASQEVFETIATTTNNPT